MIGIICAMQIEVEKINEEIENKEIEAISGITFTRGTLYGRDVVTAVCGVGKVFAAICTEVMILKYKPDIIINTGVAGTLTDKLSIGDVAVSSFVMQHDMDTSTVGDPVGMISGINIVNIPADEALCDKMAECVKSLGIRCEKGIVATGDQFVSDSGRKGFIRNTFNAICCEMEGGSVGHVCYVNNVKFVVIRAISDGAGDDSHMDYLTFAKMAADNSAKAVKKFVKDDYNG